MTRLRSDWNDHGWRRDPVYGYRLIDGKVLRTGIIGTTLCTCFYDPSFKAMARFKDTPTMNMRRDRRFELGPKDGARGGMTIQEVRALDVPREDFHVRRRRRDGIRRIKVQCVCGFVLRIVDVPFGEAAWQHRRPPGRCESCRRRLEGGQPGRR
jgi:hypothetical protein